MPDIKEIQYIQNVLKGDKNAFAPLVEIHKDMVFTLCINLLKTKELAEEKAQDVFMKAFHSLSSFRQESKFSTWLYRIAYNECISTLRKRRIKNVSLDEMHEIAEKTEENNEINIENKQNHLKIALSKLPEQDRAIILFHYYENLSLEEISGITGLSKTNVKVKLFRARKKLYDLLLPIFEKEAIFD